MLRTLVLMLTLLMVAQAVCALTLSSEDPPRMIRATRAGETVYDIAITFEEPFGDTLRQLVENPDSWRVIGENREFTVDRVGFGLDKAKCKLIGNWSLYDDVSVIFDNQTASSVTAQGARGQTVRWGFGSGKALDLNLQRLTDQQALYAFEYDIKVRPVERYRSAGGGNIWFRSLSLDLASSGALATDDEVRNGTQTSLSLSAHPFYFLGGLIYKSSLSAGYQIETTASDIEDDILNVVARQFKAGVEIEVPLTNYPIFHLHRVTGYPRLAMPLTLKFDYVAEGKDGDGGTTSARYDFGITYELAFSPYLIVNWQWHRSEILEAPPGTDQTATYYSLSFAQDLGVVKERLGVLQTILGSSEEIEGNNFIFFRISKGMDAPGFRDIDEKAIGFGTYF